MTELQTIKTTLDILSSELEIIKTKSGSSTDDSTLKKLIDIENRINTISGAKSDSNIDLIKVKLSSVEDTVNRLTLRSESDRNNVTSYINRVEFNLKNTTYLAQQALNVVQSLRVK